MNGAPGEWAALWASRRARLDEANPQGDAIDDALADLRREIAAAVVAGRYAEASALTLLVSTAHAARDGAEFDWAGAATDAPARALFWVRWARALDGAPREDALRWAIALGERGCARLEAAQLVTQPTREPLIAALRQQAEHDDLLRSDARITVAVLERDEAAFVEQLEGLRALDSNYAIPLTTVSHAALARAGWARLQTWPASPRLRLGGWLVPQLEGRERASAAATQVADYLSSDRPDLWLGDADRLAGYLERAPLDHLLAHHSALASVSRAPRALRRLAELGAPDDAIRRIGDLDPDLGYRYQQLTALRGVLAELAPASAVTIAERMCAYDAVYSWPDVLAAAPGSAVDDVVERVNRGFALDTRVRVWAALPARVLGTHAASWLATVDAGTRTETIEVAPLLALAARADVLDASTRKRLLQLCLDALARTSRLNLFGCDDHDGLSALVPLLAAIGGTPAVAAVTAALREVS